MTFMERIHAALGGIAPPHILGHVPGIGLLQVVRQKVEAFIADPAARAEDIEEIERLVEALATAATVGKSLLSDAKAKASPPTE